MKSARIVVLAVAIGAGGLAALLAGRSEKPPEVAPQVALPETVDVLVARNDIPMGTAMSPGDIQWQSWPASAATGNFIRKNARPAAIEDLNGRIARVPFVAGEPIREAKLVNAKGSGFMAAILPTGHARRFHADFAGNRRRRIHPAERPRRRHSHAPRRRQQIGGGDTKTSETILSNIRVLAIDQNIEEKNGQKVVVGKTATLELSPGQSETLVLSQQIGTLSLALRSVTDASQKDAPTDDDNSSKRNTVNVIRFGVSTTTTPK